MTRTRVTRKQDMSAGQWALQDAKACFSEVVRRAKTEGPQRITVHGREEVVVISAEEYRRMRGQLTGQALVDLLHGSSLGDIDLERVHTRSPIRGVKP